ncbi:TetR family transcriptional regulator [Planobispora longispora]|uniref:TetR family transcriptional regulator n=1 Tax=Planobispora longispora TaxID=28887 RepID=A0A8J3W8R2_9ACTN|nr:TetR/AcrR family transcriptional regulator [Planobispora longispora]GIH80944.1 TetR family transcriptional regulator [Planobispora longispora]
MVAEPTRRRLTERQADTVRRLTEAAVEEIRETGFDGLTVRNVARRAGVAPATAYTYFASKNHLVTEVFWRRLSALPPLDDPVDDPVDTAAGARERVVAVLREITLLVSDEPRLAAACTTAMLGTDPDVQELRARIGLAIRRRLRAALGSRADHRMLNALEFAYAGALLHAGMGYTSYGEMADRLADIAELIVR